MSATICCTRCGNEKPIEFFYRARLGRHGRMSWCKSCDSKRRREYDAKNTDRVKTQQKQWAKANPEKCADRARNYRRRHPEKVAAYDRAYCRENRELRAFYSRSRQAKKRQAMPHWADHEAMKLIYKNRPKGMHVDHIIPLVATRGRVQVACGLHCEFNLQYLSASENSRKWSTMPEV